jgi:ribonucleoside-diphosphate reductase alpha chain
VFFYMSSEKMSEFALGTMKRKYSHGGHEAWEQIAYRVTLHVLSAVNVEIHSEFAQKIYHAIRQRKFIPGGRYLYAAGRSLHQVQNCVLLRAQDTREGWAELQWKNGMALMTGAGVGTNYSALREEGAKISRTGGTASGPLSLMNAVNEFGRNVQQGGSRRSALWAGLSWRHPDVLKFARMKNWIPEVKALKDKDYNFPATMDGTNISIDLDDEFFVAYSTSLHPMHSHAQEIYWLVIRQMLETAEPGFSVNVGDNAGEDLRNACTEVSSHDDSDICNIGSLNMARINSLEEMCELTELATAFLVAGSVYSDIPYDAIGKTRERNRRLGLGLMGLHEWLLKRGKAYAPDADLAQYLDIYADSTRIAHTYCRKWNLSLSVKTRAIAPTGTIGIVGETTTGIEPVFCVAFKRRYLDGQTWKFQYVVDPTAKRLIDSGIAPESIEDAYSIKPEARVRFQAWLQGYVDHGISSTINLPAWGSPENNEGRVTEFGNMLMEHLPSLRGITAYPDGARGGQPLSPVQYSLAAANPGQVFVEAQDICDLTRGGSCGA